jgi:hypothetical protein
MDFSGIFDDPVSILRKKTVNCYVWRQYRAGNFKTGFGF